MIMDIKTIEEKIKNRKSGFVGQHTSFGVMVFLVDTKKGPSLLYEVRAKTLSRQPGEICFPGGQREEGETMEQCAVRETCEELGLEPAMIRVAGKLDTLHAHANFSLYCYLGITGHENISPAKINHEEVDEIFTVPLDFLLDTKPETHYMQVRPYPEEDFPYDKIDFARGYKWRTGTLEVPIYTYEDKVIWGMTARITESFIGIIKGEE